MQTELAHYRNMQPNDDMPSKTLLYAYSKYKKEREESASQQPPRAPRINKHR